MLRLLNVSLLFVLLSSVMSTMAAEPTQQAVFTAGQDGYHTYRIPSVIVTKKGVVLAFCEARKGGRGDAGDIDLVMKRSLDGGQTWLPQQVLWDDDKNTCGNPCPVVDQSTGTIWLLLTHNLGTDSESAIIESKSKGSRTCWVTHSKDEGATWSAPVDITATTKKADWTWYATGPGVGIQTKDGRLVIPCDNKVAVTKGRQAHAIYSDDHGATWKLGGVAGPNCNECQVVELSDGRLLLNMRTYRANNRRLISYSSDKGESWTSPVEDQTLIEPVCQGSIIRGPGSTSQFVFSNPASLKREKMTVRLSNDDCRSWSVSRELHAGPAAYSCLTVLPDGSLGCLYERGTKDAYETITFARFSLAWLRGE